MTSPLSVLYLGKGDRSYPSTRYRCAQFIEPLRKEGVELELRPLLGPRWLDATLAPPSGARRLRRAGLGAHAVSRRLLSLGDLKDFDLVILEQELAPLLPFTLERLLLRRARRLAVELDDAHHLSPGKTQKIPAWFAAADGVICGNEALAEAVRAVGGAPYVVPTVVDHLRYTPAAERAAGGELRLAWLGLPSNFSQLELIAGPLARLAARHPLRLHVISRGLPTLPGVAMKRVEWSEATEARELARCDLGLMPLPSSDWARGKCGLKLLQYMAAGLPAVASAVGVNRAIAQGGGVLLASDDSAWEQALGSLVAPQMRRQVAELGRENLRSNWSVERWTPELAEVYRRLASCSRKGR